jgi:hypothetical protein
VDLAVRRGGAAINGQVDAVDEASIGAREEGDGRRYLFGLRGPSERNALDRLRSLSTRPTNRLLRPSKTQRASSCKT